MLNIKFNEQAQAAEDNDLDARKLSGPDFNFYSISADNQKMTIDQRPFENGKVIPLGLNSNYAQEYVIKAEGISVPEGSELYLHDKLLQQYVLMTQGAEYKFAVTEENKTQGDNRFELSMRPVTSTANTELNVSVAPNPATEQVKVSFAAAVQNNVKINVLDLSGVSVFNQDLGLQQNGSVTLALSNLPAGIYMVELTAGDKKVVKRLVKE
jgi:hypothetical protein